MLSLSRKVDYALIALAEMARDPSRNVSVRDVADRMDVPGRLLANILNQLTHCGLVTSSRGLRGGYRLARPADQITLATLIEAVEGPMQLTYCCPTPPQAERRGVCQLQGKCGVREPVQKLHAQLRNFLSQVTLHDIVTDAVSVDYGDLDLVASVTGNLAESTSDTE